MAIATLRRPDAVEGVKKALLEALSQIEAPSFACGGVMSENLNPGLFLNDHGIVGLPLSKNDAGAIISKATQSPFGKGEETLVDTSVRKSWQLEPAQFSIRNPKWNNMIGRILHDVYRALDLDCGRDNVCADLYKLLLYEEGAFFKPHRDSEKAPGMFGTLMICLPSSHRGGELVLTHNDETVEFNTSSTSDFDISYAAWYSDVLHEVKPVTQGYRLVLIYNLVRRESTTVSVPASPTQHQDRIVSVLKQWYVDIDAPKSPDYLVYALEHQYTQASLQLKLLKSPDFGRVLCLDEAALRLGFSLYLASTERKVKIDINGEDELSRETTMQHVVTLNGDRVDDPSADYGISVSQDRVINVHDDRLPDDEDHIEVTGNEGSLSFYWYRDTVVVIVPPSKRLEFLHECDHRPETILSRLQNLRQDTFTESWDIFPGDSAVQDLTAYASTVLEYQYRYSRPFIVLEHKRARWAKILQEIVAFAIERGNWTLYDQAVRKSHDGMSIEIFQRLGLALAQREGGRRILEIRISEALQDGFSLCDRQAALHAVKEGFFRCPEPPKGDEKEMARLIHLFDDYWVDTVIGDARCHYRTMNKAEGESIGRIARLLDDSYIDFSIIGQVFSVPIACKIGFCNELLAPTESWNYPRYWMDRYPNGALPQQPQTTLETRLELVRERLLKRIWHDFERNPALINYRPTNRQYTLTPTTRSWIGHDPQSPSARILNGKDLRQLITNSCLAGILTEQDALDCLSTALRASNKETCVHTLLPFVDEIMTSGFLNERDPNTGQVRIDIRRVVLELLMYYLRTCVGPEPPGTVSWSQDLDRGCGCTDCNTVQEFLRSPTERVARIPCTTASRRQHLQTQFYNRQIKSYTIVTLRDRTPNEWHITKKNELFDKKTVWEKNRDDARVKLAPLNRAGRLKDYLFGRQWAEIILAADYDGAVRAAHLKNERARAKIAAQGASTSASTSTAASPPTPRNPLQPVVTNTLNTTQAPTSSKRASDAGSGAQAEQTKKVKTQPVEEVNLTGV
ncbi:hypothetical protein HRR83_005573 [Exophiala dermatitidis]|uniref:Fe2OG dioxygenase domain-containing protein n=1 Tax=Exophiala dermatitidis TaxID=5970 RepID=A0AAN6EQT5_EXODE|nr:hypothetical protein HRR74_009195 [Exophiala dermatitidis]KAJ4508155.1 hypothetical protein HRR73_007594 [Exophiala dermatitidis]KAJ4531921.1 hypothetical protein HRR77_009052 [Exophiala dermatitidis]KAJ4537890.1 hypothetical protein HRR78_008482 [Exophiala dermatitidis]KAJ4540067.1 hypothetical protein HRR76_003485 [Exophiala dermatitidis]